MLCHFTMQNERHKLFDVLQMTHKFIFKWMTFSNIEVHTRETLKIGESQNWQANFPLWLGRDFLYCMHVVYCCILPHSCSGQHWTLIEGLSIETEKNDRVLKGSAGWLQLFNLRQQHTHLFLSSSVLDYSWSLMCPPKNKGLFETIVLDWIMMIWWKEMWYPF